MGGMGFSSRMMDPGAWDAWVVLTWLVVGLLVVAGAVVVAWLVRGGRQGFTPRNVEAGRSAADILDERFARGELSDEEFERRRRTLTSR